MANNIEKPQAPALPQAKEEYTRSFADENNNVLRLFFNRITSALDNIFSATQGGKFIYMPRGYFYSATDQSAAGTNTGYAVAFEVSTIASGVTMTGSNKRITATDSGTYNFQVMLQASESGGAAADVTVYAKLNGTSIAYGGQIHTVPASGEAIIPFNFSAALTAGQYIEIYWATTDTNVTLNATATAGVHVGLASARAAVSFVSNS